MRTFQNYSMSLTLQTIGLRAKKKEYFQNNWVTNVRLIETSLFLPTNSIPFAKFLPIVTKAVAKLLKCYVQLGGYVATELFTIEKFYY